MEVCLKNIYTLDLCLKLNTPLKLHGSDVYTRAMFENFGEVLYEGGQYKVEVVSKGKTYFVRWYHPKKHE